MAERKSGMPFEGFFARATRRPGDDATTPVPEGRSGGSSREECGNTGEGGGMISRGDGDGSPWSDATWAGNRLRQHREFLSLSFREKLLILEQMGEVAAILGRRSVGRTSDGWERRCE